MCCGSAEFDAQTGNYKFVDDFLSLRNLEWIVTENRRKGTPFCT
jgi:hypothetical protein